MVVWIFVLNRCWRASPGACLYLLFEGLSGITVIPALLILCSIITIPTILQLYSMQASAIHINQKKGSQMRTLKPNKPTKPKLNLNLFAYVNFICPRQKFDVHLFSFSQFCSIKPLFHLLLNIELYISNNR